MSLVLIVDDLPDEVAVLKSAVAALGHDSIVASDGEAAVELSRKERPNLVLLDVVLPKMDGFEACRKIKKNPETNNIPVILVSSKTQESDQFWGYKQGANAYIRKPFRDGEIQAALKAYLK